MKQSLNLRLSLLEARGKVVGFQVVALDNENSKHFVLGLAQRLYVGGIEPSIILQGTKLVLKNAEVEEYVTFLQEKDALALEKLLDEDRSDSQALELKYDSHIKADLRIVRRGVVVDDERILDLQKD